MENNLETLEQQTAPESTRGLFDTPAEKKLPSHRESAPVPDKRRSFQSIGPLEPSRSRPLISQQQQKQPQNRGHQRSRSASASEFLSNQGGRRNFGLQTLMEEEDAQRKKKEKGTVDSLQEMINTLKNLPPIISTNGTNGSHPLSKDDRMNNSAGNGRSFGHRKQQSMSALVSGGARNHQVTTNKRMSYNNGSDMQTVTQNTVQDFRAVSDGKNNSFDSNRRRSKRSQSVSSYVRRDSTNGLSRDEALAEAEAKLMGTFQLNNKKEDGNRRSLDFHSRQLPRRYSESSGSFDPSPVVVNKSVSSGMSRRTSLQLPTLSENAVVENDGVMGGRRRITFNKPLNVSAANSFNPADDYTQDRRLSAGGYQRRSSRNLDMDWRATASSNVPFSAPSSPLKNNFNLVPFTPTRVNFSRDDANPHQRRPLFVAHLPFSALPPLFRVRQLVKGTLRVNKRNRSDAYVYCEELDADIYVCGSRDRNRALEGDVVAVRLADVEKVLREKKEKEEAKLARNGGQTKVRLPDEEDENEVIFGGDDDIDVVKPKYAGVVVAILERAQNQVFSGTLTLMRPNNKRAEEEKAAEEARNSIHGSSDLPKKAAPRIVWFKSTDKRVPLIAIPIEQAPKDFVDNSEAYSTRLFVGSMKRWPITSLHPFGTLERELGSVYELTTQTKAILADNNVTDSEFSEAVMGCLPTLPFSMVGDESRRDLRDSVTFTIDSANSEVLDDALSIKKLEDDVYEVGVHISDVTYFIKSQSALDKEARARGVRVELLHSSVPMLPETLTKEVTNLMPNETRLTFSVIWKMNAKGEILDTWYGKTIIRSSAKLTFEDAQNILDKEPLKDISDSNLSSQISVDVTQLYALASELRRGRETTGIFTQMRDELKYEFEDGNTEEPITVSISSKKSVTTVVNEFLLLANTSVAQKIADHFPNHALLRRHASPYEHKINELRDYTARHLGVKLDTTNAGSLESSIRTIEDPKLRKLISTLVLKTFQPPKYFCAGSIDISKYSHYALNTALYTHFTSPSKRFSDIIVHRQLEAAISEEKRFPLDRDTIQKLAQHCNVKKNAAIYAREQSSQLFLGIHLQKLSLQQQKTSIIPNSLSVVFREAIVISVFDQFFDIIIPELNLERRIHLACLPVWRFDHSAQNGTLTMFWRKGVDTSTGKQGEWSLSDEEDDDEMDEDALLEEMNQGSDDASSPVQEDYKNPVATEGDSSIVSKLAVKEATNDPVVPKKTVSTPLARIPEPTRSTNRRASIVRARLSDSTAYSTEQGYQTIKALDKIRVVIITEMTRTPPTIRILAANPFS